MFNKLFGKKVAAAKVELKKVKNRDLMEAIVGGCLLVSAADGEIEKEETSKLDQLIRSNPRLAHFGNEITSTINRYTEQLEAGFRVGRMNILREIDDIKKRSERSRRSLRQHADYRRSGRPDRTRRTEGAGRGRAPSGAAC